MSEIVVIGSGATGGWAAKTLTDRGVEALILEAGSDEPANTPRRSSLIAEIVRLASRKTGNRMYSVTPDLWVNPTDIPYTTPENRPFHWGRIRRVGGRTLAWNRILIRMSQMELGEWPLRYEDLKTQYDAIETFLGVHGNCDDHAGIPDGIFLPPFPATPAEEAFRRAVESESNGWRVIAGRGISAGKAGYADSSAETSLKAALSSGKAKLRCNSVVTKILMDDRGRAKVLELVDPKTFEHSILPVKAVILCASTIETLRLLLNSGIGNRSGLLGNGIMDHYMMQFRGVLPAAGKIRGKWPLGGEHSLIITGKNYGIMANAQRLSVDRALAYVGLALFGMTAYGEMQRREENRVTLDPSIRDIYGVPAAHINCAWSDSDRAAVAKMRADILQLVASGGGKILVQTPLSVPGEMFHEVGGARMGKDPSRSVVDPYGRVWDAPNVFVGDGASWVTCGWQNPTLTMMALAGRAAERLAEDLARGAF